jgi:hypothetical protein
MRGTLVGTTTKSDSFIRLVDIRTNKCNHASDGDFAMSYFYL